MKLTIVRNEFNENETLGTLLIEHEQRTWRQCETLEDTDRFLEANPDAKVQDRTAIPRGTYRVADTWSPRFKRRMLQLLDVPHFSGVRIHSGSSHLHTSGCILLGEQRLNGKVIRSVLAVEALEKIVRKALAQGEAVTVRIV